MGFLKQLCDFSDSLLELQNVSNISHSTGEYPPKPSGPGEQATWSTSHELEWYSHTSVHHQIEIFCFIYPPDIFFSF